MNRTTTKLSLQDFLKLPQSNQSYELVEGQLKPKMSPKYKHSTLQLRLLLGLNVEIDLNLDLKPFQTSNFVTITQ